MRYFILIIFLVAAANFVFFAMEAPNDLAGVGCWILGIIFFIAGWLQFIYKLPNVYGFRIGEKVIYQPNFKAACESPFKTQIPRADNLLPGYEYEIQDIEGDLLNLIGCRYLQHSSQFIKDENQNNKSK